MSRPSTEVDFLTKPSSSMVDAMRAALQLSSALPEPSHIREMRASYNSINAMLNREVVTDGNSTDNLPQLLRLFDGKNNVGGFAAMVGFANSPQQRLVNWRNCAAHKDRLAAMDLSDPQGAFKKLYSEARGQQDSNTPPESLPRSSPLPMPRKSKAITASPPESFIHKDSTPTSCGSQPEHTAGATLLHPTSTHSGASTPQLNTTTLSPCSTSMKKPAKAADIPHTEHEPFGNVHNSSTPSSSPFRPISTQEHSQKNKTHRMEGHMPHLSAEVRSPPIVCTNPQSNPYARVDTPLYHDGVVPQRQTPYMYPQASYGHGNRYAPSLVGQTAQPQGHQHKYLPQVFYPPAQQRNGRSVMNPLAEFAAEVNSQQPPNLYMPSNLSSPLSRQQEGLVKYGPRTGPRVLQQSQSGLTQHRLSNTAANLTTSHEVAAPPAVSVRPKTKEYIEYEEQLATWKKDQAEQAKQQRIQNERRKKLKDELDAETKLGKDVLNYRYHDYLEVYPLGRNDRKSPYHLGLLANQVIEKDDHNSEKAIAVRYAKENWENCWTVNDQAMVTELLREKMKVQDRGMFEEMKTGGHQVSASDLKAIRQGVSSYAQPEESIGR